MEFQRLSIFCKVYEKKSVSKAAEELMMTQPAVSSHLRKLEQTFHMKLLERQGNEMIPTYAGVQFYHYARQILKTHEEALQLFAVLQQGQKGHIKIGVGDGLIYQLPFILKNFRDQYPNVEISYEVKSSNQICSQVGEYALDMGLVWEQQMDYPNLEIISRIQDEFVLIFPPGHPLAKYEAIPVQELQRQHFIVPLQGTPGRQFVESVFKRTGIQVRTIMEFVSIEAIKQAVLANLGLALVSRKAVGNELSLGVIETRPIDGAYLNRFAHIVIRKNRVLNQAILNLITFIKEHHSAGESGK